MKFVAVLNKELKTGLAINGLAQMSLGLGHRVAGQPDVTIFWGTTAQVRAFRTLVSQRVSNATDLIYRDFPDTMEGGDTNALWERVTSTPEEKVTYVASCFVAEDIDSELRALIQGCSQLANYKPYVSNSAASFLEEKPGLERGPEEMIMKTMTMINKVSLDNAINQVVLANLETGRKAPYEDLNLLTGGRITYISYNTHPIVKADPKKHAAMTAAAKKIDGLYTTNLGEVTVVFGLRKLVDEVIIRKDTRIYNAELNLIPVQKAQDETSAHCQ